MNAVVFGKGPAVIHSEAPITERLRAEIVAMGAEVRENVDTLFNPPGAVHLGILPSWEGFLEAYRVIDRIRLMDDASDRQSEPIVRGIVTMSVIVKLQALAIPQTDGGFSVIVPALKGCFSAADTIEEAQANAVEAAEDWLASSHESNAAEAIRVATGVDQGERQQLGNG